MTKVLINIGMLAVASLPNWICAIQFKEVLNCCKIQFIQVGSQLSSQFCATQVKSQVIIRQVASQWATQVKNTGENTWLFNVCPIRLWWTGLMVNHVKRKTHGLSSPSFHLRQVCFFAPWVGSLNVPTQLNVCHGGYFVASWHMGPRVNHWWINQVWWQGLKARP